MKEIKNRDSKSFRSFIMGAVSMFAFMIGDWLLDAAGAGDAELGLVAHTNWPGMSMWRFLGHRHHCNLFYLPGLQGGNRPQP